ncbi:NAD(P)-dependent oxidoreductase [Flavimobilis sp. GY10621]|uniref:NAD(P)-dependent oxidoreductase n=1 Tax=Flavimobilis rhizosphaerae TaxID=2775421 RepID=A0ABR9DS33_9MICO|nr:NAD(P)-dependent oxidoreductase [Flavimobilis rhizosphaerae]MBD9699964.1 NAD(P)-dependent oxidoreductase [Flavimobilis rhizosphaerae]
MRVAVTGASGFVGGAVARALATDGHDVRTFSRRPAHVGTWRVWDLADGALADPPEVDAVVHVGAAVADGGKRAAAARINVDGTRAVRETFRGARMIHVSSASVYDPRVPTVAGREDTPLPGRHLNAYGATKAAAERYLAGTDLGPVLVLRPHAVYGPGDTTLLPRVEGLVRRGRVPLVGDGSALHSFTHVDTFVEAVRAGLARDVTGVVNVADAEPWPLRRAVLELLGRRGHRGPDGGPLRVAEVPPRLAYALAAALDGAAAFGLPRSRLSRYALSHLAVERTLDLTRLRTWLGVEPPATTLEGAETW